ncbi:unnamed protein product [Cochlearia groenlandica]
MEESQRSFSPPPCPSTVTVRRNPPRRARATPYTAGAKPPAVSLASAANTHEVPSFPIDEILSIQIPQSEPKSSVTESLKIFLRIKPLKSFAKVNTTPKKSRPRNVWPQNPSTKKSNNAKENRNQEIAKKEKKREEACVALNDSYSVTLTPPQALQELKRSKTEVYEGFSHVFPADCFQSDVYDKMVQPLLEDFMKGKSGMLAALGPSGSGKTHTVFGTPKDPGVVPLTLRQIFKKRDESSSGSVRSFYLSIFEICSERGKGEKAYDLLGDGGSELSVQQSTIRGLKEVPIHTFEEAESLIEQAMLKRATATTNSNSQSSRSQCIINIRSAYDAGSNETKMHSTEAMLTIVDLAGAEREKRTGNQGERLVESNFINNTSMVFGQCLRALLEYQKNKKKGFQKHHQNSLLTRYLRDYLEGKRRMALILTVKAGEDDYLDTSYLLRQASPYMKIKFDNTEGICNKRQLKTFPRVEQTKKIKLTAKTSKGKKADRMDKSSPRLEHVSQDKNEREHIIMQNFAKVIWSVLKQYNEKLKIAESDIHCLKENLRSEQLKSSALETELNSLKSSCLFSKLNLADAFLPEVPEVEALVHEELLEVDLSLANAERSVDEDPHNLNETRREVSAEECESPAPSKNVVHDLGNEENSSAKQDDPTPSPEKVEVSRECVNNQLSSIQTKSAISRRFPDSEKQERNRRLLPASSRSITEEMNDLEIKDNQIEKSQVKRAESNVVQKNTESTQALEIEVPTCEAEPASTKKQRNRQKPRRRLEPASSVLLTREINTLEIEDDITEAKGTRGVKKTTTIAQPRSQGSATLLRLLTNFIS